MKKLLLLLMVSSVGIAGTATAQKKSKKDCGNDKNKYSKKYDRRNDDRYDRNGSYGKYSNNAPRQVRDAFKRDYPNASNVSWTKDRGVWTANFKRNGLFGGNNSVSYKANGQRVNSDSFGFNKTAKANTQRPGGFWK